MHLSTTKRYLCGDVEETTLNMTNDKSRKTHLNTTKCYLCGDVEETTLNILRDYVIAIGTWIIKWINHANVCFLHPTYNNGQG